VPKTYVSVDQRPVCLRHDRWIDVSPMHECYRGWNGGVQSDSEEMAAELLVHIVQTISSHLNLPNFVDHVIL